MSPFDDDWAPYVPPDSGKRSKGCLPATLAILFGTCVLLALLIPFIQAERRGDGRRSRCPNNLRVMGLGIAGYMHTHDRLPPGTIPGDRLPPERRLGWGVAILPYIDQVEYLGEHGIEPGELPGVAWDDPRFEPLGTIERPGITRCPDSPSRAGYVAIAGLGVDSPGLPTGHPRAGLFGDDRVVRPSDLKDGASTTMMLAESEPARASWFAGGRATVRGLDPGRPPYIGPGRQFGGMHKGGVNVLFADGSVKSVKDSINPRIFEALSTIAGGEILSDEVEE